MEVDQDHNSCPENGAWTKTKEALAHFRELLLCSKCSEFMSEPMCLGVCEHMLCRACAGPGAGDGCTVCRSPAWVKDIQINRQLSNITELFCRLEALCNPPEATASLTDTAGQLNRNAVIRHKKNYKIWFSPKSRKVRCQVEKTVEGMSSGPLAEMSDSKPPESSSKDLSIFNFNSSQDSGSSSPSKGKENKARRKRMMKKGVSAVRRPAGSGSVTSTKIQPKQLHSRMRLQAINQLWGFSKEGGMDEMINEEEEEKRGGSEDNERNPSKRVSFQCPGSPTQGPVSMPQAEGCVFSTSGGILRDAATGEPGPTHEMPASDPQSTLACPDRPDRPVAEAKDQAEPPPHRKAAKRAREGEGPGSPDTPKRPRPSPGRGRRPVPKRSVALFTPPPTPDRPPPPGLTRRFREERRERESPARSPGRVKGSPATPPGGSGGRHSQSSPAFMKRNHKGETALHLASIKGDVAEVRQLLLQGADPNLKDNAGWTPLHEACNHGHLGVVEVLVQEGVLLNTPGYQNDSPLHDAVRNGHAAVAKLLLDRGASPSVLNMFGLTPADYAVTQEMQAVLTVPAEEPHPLDAPLSPPASLPRTAGCGRRDGPVTLLGSELTQAQQNQLRQAAQTLGGKRAESFSSAVTHVIVPDGPVPSTLGALQGILSGCWILRFSWLKQSLKAGGWSEESAFEVADGALRGRLNRLSLLPPLFDGCFFFFLGSFKKPPKGDLLQLVRGGGGQLLARQPKPDSDVTQTLSAAAYHAPPGSDQALCTQYIIYDPQGPYAPPRVRRGKVWSAPSTWLLGCVSAFRLLPVPEPEPPGTVRTDN